MIHLTDHLLVGVIAALSPLYSWFQTRKTVREQARPDAKPLDTIHEIKLAIVALAVLGALGLGNWLLHGRDPDQIGLGVGASPVRWALGLALAVVGLLLTMRQRRQVEGDAEARAEIREQIAHLDFALPRTSGQLRWFDRVAVAAGLFEEILYRGFMIWYLQHWMPVIPALLVSSLVFGLAHSYQGVASIPRTGFIGLWCGGIYLLCGALWPAMVTHALFDMIAGRIMHVSLVEGPAGNDVPTEAASSESTMTGPTGTSP